MQYLERVWTVHAVNSLTPATAEVSALRLWKLYLHFHGYPL
jgi:hypothetical protein